MTVLMAALQWPPETFILRAAEQLAAKGFHVQIAATRREGYADLPTSGLEIIDLPRCSTRPLQRIVSFVRLLCWKLVSHPSILFRFARYLRSTSLRSKAGFWSELHRYLPFVGLKPNVLHFQWNSSAIEYEALYDLLGCPVVVSCRGAQVQVAPHNPRRSAEIVEGLARTFQRSARIHCVSTAIRDEAESYGATPGSAVVIRPAVDPVFFTPGASESSAGDRLRIVTVGSLAWRKDQETTLVAVRHLIDRGVSVELTIAGDGPERQWLQFTAADLDIANCVTFVGKVGSAECRRLLQASHAFVLSSVSEGISNAALEAMACGLPVVTTDCGGMREAVRDGIDGFVVPTRNPVAIADALFRLAQDGALRQQMGTSARQRIVDEFSLGQQAEAFTDLYRSLSERVA